MKSIVALLTLGLIAVACDVKTPDKHETLPYYDMNESGVKSGGIRMIPIHDGKFKVWTKRI